jgi:hypothetical protein
MRILLKLTIHRRHTLVHSSSESAVWSSSPPRRRLKPLTRRYFCSPKKGVGQGTGTARRPWQGTLAERLLGFRQVPAGPGRNPPARLPPRRMCLPRPATVVLGRFGRGNANRPIPQFQAVSASHLPRRKPLWRCELLCALARERDMRTAYAHVLQPSVLYSTVQSTHSIDNPTPAKMPMSSLMSRP